MSIERAFLGMQGSMVPATFISRTVAEGETIAPAIPVAVDGTERRWCKPAVDGEGFLGIHCPTSMDGEQGELASARIITQGVVYVQADAAVSAGDPVGFNADGEWGAADAADYPYQIDGAQFDDDADAGELVPIRMMGTQVTELQ